MRSRNSPVPGLDAATRARLRGWLQAPRYEILPTTDVLDELAGLGGPVTVTVTASAKRGQAATVAVAEQVAALGHRAVPHLAARLLRDDVELKELVDRLAQAGIDEVFLIAGDADRPAGEFASTLDVLPVLAGPAGYAPELRIGVAGYPEGHPRIADPLLRAALHTKADDAAYVVSQMCFDPAAVTAWLAAERERGLTLPVMVGVPGPIQAGRLLRMATRIGVTSSLRFLSGHTSMARLVAPGAFDPLPILTGVAATGTPPDGVHLYTFNAVAATDAWRRRLLETDLATIDDGRNVG